MCARRRTGGFTLIELMVVIVVLAVLTTLGIPSFMEMIQNVNQINPPIGCGTVATIQTRSGSEGSEKASVSTTGTTGPDATTVTFTPTGWTTASCSANPIAQVNVGSSVLNAAQERPLEIRVTASGGMRLCAPWVGDASDLNPPASAANWRLPVGDPRRC